MPGYMWIIIGLVVFIMLIVGFIADITDFGHKKLGKKQPVKPVVEEEPEIDLEKLKGKTLEGLISGNESIDDSKNIYQVDGEPIDEDLYAPLENTNSTVTDFDTNINNLENVDNYEDKKEDLFDFEMPVIEENTPKEQVDDTQLDFVTDDNATESENNTEENENIQNDFENSLSEETTEELENPVEEVLDTEINDEESNEKIESEEIENTDSVEKILPESAENTEEDMWADDSEVVLEPVEETEIKEEKVDKKEAKRLALEEKKRKKEEKIKERQEKKEQRKKEKDKKNKKEESTFEENIVPEVITEELNENNEITSDDDLWKF